MPGFAGVLGADPAIVGRLDLMCAALTRRDEDAHGTFRSPHLGAHIGWIERSDSGIGVRPIWNETRDVVLFLYGEVHADRDCLDILRRKGHVFGDVCAEHVVHLYEEHGAEFVGRLNGWFSGLLLDLRRQESILFNDRFGVGRIYVKETAAGLCFSSEAKSLLRGFPDSRKLDSAALGESFAYGCVLGDRTLFQGIALMPAASRWSLPRQGSIRRESYFDRRLWEAQESLSDEHFYGELRETFHRLLPRYLRGSSVAMSLTGGLDGRMIMAWARAPAGGLPCYSFSGPFRECHDVRIARKIALECGQLHHTIDVGENLLGNFPDLAAQCIRVSDGTMDVSGAVELLVNREARSLASVRLTGNYGSEIVRGNVAFRPQRLRMENYEPSFAGQISAANETYAAERRVSDLTFIAFKQVPWYHHARASVERSQLDTRSPFLDNELVALMYRASPKAQRSRDLSLRLIHDGNPRLAKIPTDRAFRYGPVTIRNRLSQAILDFSAKAEYAYDYGMPDWLCKVDSAVSALQPERWFLGRHKFYHFRTWYRRNLADFIQDMLLSPAARARSPYRKGALEAIVRGHVRGTQNHTEEIHRALTHELTHRLLLDDTGL
jgi:asparagine synthase (glutamine-hydrolysing)